MNIDRRPPLIERSLRGGPQRHAFDGAEIIPLDHEQPASSVRRLANTAAQAMR